MLGLRAGAWFNFIFGRQYAGIPREIDAAHSVSLVERNPVVITETVMDTHTVAVPKTTTVEVTYHVPLNTSTSATSATIPFASTAISNSTSAINPSLLLSDGQQFPTSAAEEDILPETSDANETTAPTETAAQPTTQEAPLETPDEARLEDGRNTEDAQYPTSEVLLFDSASLTWTGPAGISSTTRQTRSGATTAASAPESTQASDGIVPDDNETGITDPRPSLTTSTLPGGLITTVGLDATAGSDKASETDDGAGIISQESNETKSTPVIVGSIIGSFMGLSMLVFLLWFVKRRSSRKRRSTLLTPLGLPLPPSGPSSSDGETYETNNHSLGPTPRSTKVAAAVTVNANKFGRALRLSTSGSPHVNMNRGNSQFLESTPPHSRPSMGQYHNRASSSPEVVQGWWSRLIPESSAEQPSTQDMAEKGRETTRSSSPNPLSDANAIPMPRGIPYSDGNNMSQGSLVPPPLAPGRQQRPPRPPRSDDPFADSDSITSQGAVRLTPTTYVADVQESRGPSMYRNLTPQAPGKADLAPPMKQAWRDSIHSNPFDLELDGRHVPSASNIYSVSRYTAASSFHSMPKRTTTHSRSESFNTRAGSA